MKPLNLKIIFISVSAIFLISLVTTLHSYETGITGLTKKNGAVGCVCHGIHVPDTNVIVTILGPDSVAVGQSAYYRLKIMGGPHVAGGLDVAVGHGTLDTAGIETITRKQIQYYSATDSAYEITHNFPKSFTGDTVSFYFKYKAPGFAGYDTLFGNGNSVNVNHIPDDTDAWNFSADKRIRIYIPIGIENISTVASEYSLGQNYPNPFNPSTAIKFSLQKESFVNLVIFDISGRIVDTPQNSMLRPGEYKFTFDAARLASGIYFYRITAGKFIETRKMILIK